MTRLRRTAQTKLVGAATAASGSGLVLAPRISLQAMGADSPDPAPLLFRVVGMFMVVSGGVLASAGDSPAVLRWSVIQKIAASTAVAGGVATGQYHPRALAVAAFDAASAVALVRMLRRR
jgi:hypothetical protein